MTTAALPVVPARAGRRREPSTAGAKVRDWLSMSPPRRADPPLVLDLEVTPGHLIRRVQRAHEVLWGRLVGSEVTSPQFAVLSSIARHTGVDQVTVGEEAALDKSTTVGIVRRLVRDGWVTTEPDPQDRRRKVLHLSGPARAALDPLTTQVAALQEALLTPLRPAARRDIVSDLAVIAYEGRLPAPGPVGTLGLESSSTIGHLIRRAQHVHNAAWATAFGGAVTGPQYAVLVAVARLGPVDQVGVGAEAALDRSSLSEVVDRLESKGMLAVEEDPTDRRRKRLQLAGGAEAALSGLTATAAQVQASLLGHLPAARHTPFVRALAAVAGGHPS